MKTKIYEPNPFPKDLQEFLESVPEEAVMALKDWGQNRSRARLSVEVDTQYGSTDLKIYMEIGIYRIDAQLMYDPDDKIFKLTPTAVSP
jgi:hypothetical protein